MNTISPIKCNENMLDRRGLYDKGHGKAFPSAGIRPSFGFGTIEVWFRKSDEKQLSSDLCRHTENYSDILHSSSASSLPWCNIEQAYSIKKHVGPTCVQKLAAPATRKAYTIDQTCSLCPHDPGAFLEPERGCYK